jgi:hypothetical protein
LGCHYLQTAEHLHKASSGAKGRRYSHLLHGFIFARHRLCHERFLWDEPKLALFGAPETMYISTSYGKTGIKIPMLLSAISLLHTFISFYSGKNVPRLSDEAKKVIAKVGHWYLDEQETYIRVFGATGAPHLLPIYVPDRLVLGEICYQTILQGYNETLVKDKKWVFIPYGFHIGFYMVKDTVHAKQLGLGQLEF